MSQTRSGDDLVGRIRLKIESAHVHAHLAGDGPNMHLVQCCGERLMIEAILKATQLIQFRNLPEDNRRNALVRIFGEDGSLVRGDACFEGLDEKMSVQIEHPRQLQSKRDRHPGPR
jgi:hypothetical protein